MLSIGNHFQYKVKKIKRLEMLHNINTIRKKTGVDILLAKEDFS